MIQYTSSKTNRSSTKDSMLGMLVARAKANYKVCKSSISREPILTITSNHCSRVSVLLVGTDSFRHEEEDEEHQ